MIHQKQIEVNTLGRSIIDLTSKITKFVVDSNINTGLCNIFIQHTSASLIICENADPAVQLDLEIFLSNIVPDGDPRFSHYQEGPDDMPAHIRTILTDNSITIPIHLGKLALGNWQGVFLWRTSNFGPHALSRSNHLVLAHLSCLLINIRSKLLISSSF